jgi:hypothetical protein
MPACVASGVLCMPQNAVAFYVCTKSTQDTEESKGEKGIPSKAVK